LTLTATDYVNHNVEQLQQYLKAVTANTITVGNFERKAVERFLNTYKVKYDYRESELTRCLKFFSLINISFRGEIIQMPLSAWQVFIIASVYCFYYRDSDKRVINQAVISTAGKNGKSSFICGLALFESVFDFELNANIALISLTNKQSKEILQYCKQMIEMSPLLSELFKINHSTIYNKQRQSTNSILLVTNEADKIQGLNTSATILDEVWLYDNLDIINIALKKSSARKNPLQFLVGTFSNTDSKTYEDLYLPCVNILEGLVQNDRMFIYFFQQDDLNEVDNPDTWRKSNPSLNTVQNLEDLINAYDQIKIFPSSKRTFLSDSLNFWNESALDEVWLEDEVIVNSMKIRRTIQNGSQVWLGLDLSTNTDLSAISIISETNGEFICKTINIMPNAQKNFIKKNGVDISKWFVNDVPLFIENGFVSVENENSTECVLPCQTPVLDEELIYEIIIALSKQFKIKSIGYDPYNSHQIIYRLEQAGIECNQVKQNPLTLSFPLKVIEKHLIEQKFFFELNPCTRWQAKNINLYTDTNGNIKLMKKAGLSIDAWVATNIAMVEYLKENYNRQDLLLSKFA
jgi:phage terminase large subunit-like protein